MPRMTNKRILKEYLIICEGRDAQEFLINYINNPNLKKAPRFENDIQVFDFGGITELDSFLKTLKNMDGFTLVKSLLIIRDAESNADAAVSQIKSALKKVA